jgi:hypothetical protein
MSIPGSASPPTGQPTWATTARRPAIRLGLVGPRDQLSGIRRWIDRCRSPIDAKDDKYPRLFPGFPGCDSDTGLCTTLTIADRNCRELPSRELERAIGLPGEPAVQAMVDVYMNELEALAEGNRTDVIIVARPDTLDDVHLTANGSTDTGRAPAADTENGGPAPVRANFHDLLKARALRLGIPLHLRAVLAGYQEHYNAARPHQGLGQRIPDPGPIRASPQLTPARARMQADFGRLCRSGRFQSEVCKPSAPAANRSERLGGGAQRGQELPECTGPPVTHKFARDINRYGDRQNIDAAVLIRGATDPVRCQSRGRPPPKLPLP